MPKPQSKRTRSQAVSQADTVSLYDTTSIENGPDTTGSDVVAYTRTFAKECKGALKEQRRRLDLWLKELAGRKFRVEYSDAVIASVRHAVARAGCELVYNSQLVTLHCDSNKKRLHAMIRVVTLGEKKQELISGKSTFPIWKSRPIENRA